MSFNICLLTFSLLLYLPTYAVQVELFPEVISWKKAPEIKFENGKLAPLEKNLKIKNSFVITTRIDDEVTLKFSGGEEITVLPKTKVEVPQVSPDTGDVSEFIIVDGAVRYRAPEIIEARSKLRLKSAFFDLKIPAGVDALFSLNMSLPLAKIQVIEGEMKAEFLDFEKKQLLRSGDSVAFDGEKDDEKNVEAIKYDYLLNGRRSPHGKLGPVEKFDYNTYVKLEKDKLQAERDAALKQKQLADLKKQKQKAFENSFLCKKPFGQRDECYWIKKDATCYRHRCNASGKWGDPTERPLDAKCKSQPHIGVCDY